MQQEPITSVHYFTIQEFSHEITFKLSPNPPMDWLVLGIPVMNGSKKYRFDRLYFCAQLKQAVMQFMRDNNLNCISNPDVAEKFKDPDNYDDIAQIIFHPWFADERL